MSITIPAKVNTESIRLRYLVVILRRADVLDLPQPGQYDEVFFKTIKFAYCFDRKRHYTPTYL